MLLLHVGEWPHGEKTSAGAFVAPPPAAVEAKRDQEEDKPNQQTDRSRPEGRLVGPTGGLLAKYPVSFCAPRMNDSQDLHVSELKFSAQCF